MGAMTVLGLSVPVCQWVSLLGKAGPQIGASGLAHGTCHLKEASLVVVSPCSGKGLGTLLVGLVQTWCKAVEGSVGFAAHAALNRGLPG